MILEQAQSYICVIIDLKKSNKICDENMINLSRYKRYSIIIIHVKIY